MYFGDNSKLYYEDHMLADPFGEHEIFVSGYTRETFFLKRWFGYPKYTEFQNINGRFVIVGYKDNLEEANVPASQKNTRGS